MLHAAAACAFANVEINAAGLKDPAKVEDLRSRVSTFRAEAEALLDAARRAFAERLA